MTCRGFCLATVAVLAIGLQSALAVDTVKRTEGKPVAGTVDDMSSTEVTVTQSGIADKVPVNTIVWIQFESEPKDLTSARTKAAAGQYTDAEKLLSKVAEKGIKRKEIKADVEFYKGMVAAKLALAGNGSIKDAGNLLIAFEKNNPDNYHAFEANELIGNLIVSSGKYEAAQKFYAKLAAAPFDEYKIRGGVLIGRALLAQKQYAKAAAKFDEVLNLGGTGKEVQHEKGEAELGKVEAMAGAGKADEAAKKVEALIDEAAKAESEDTAWFARAYLTLGKCLVKKDDKRDAIVAFAAVDSLYNTYPEVHAEALAYLAKLFVDPSVNNPRKGTQVQATLKKLYPNAKPAQL